MRVLRRHLHMLKVASNMPPKKATRSTVSLATQANSTVQAEHSTDGKQKLKTKTESAPGVAAQTSRSKKRKPEQQTVATPSKRARIKTPEAQASPNNINGTSSLDRPAEPHRTNAPLITPQGSRHVTYPQGSVNVTPVTNIPRPTTTTGHVLEQACAHLIQVEPKLQPLIEKHYCRVFCPEGLAEECDPFKSLCSGIMAQQVSGAAASSIKRKFISLFHPPVDSCIDDASSFPTPKQVTACNIAFLRECFLCQPCPILKVMLYSSFHYASRGLSLQKKSRNSSTSPTEKETLTPGITTGQAGLSERKAEYIKGLAEKFVSGELGAAMLINASDEEVLEKLTAVRGLGKWSVEMFACFGLKRMDIFSTGDLGVQCVSPPCSWKICAEV